ncbi:leukocyte immunoglobulin-like receptor subfamily A member 5 [Sorex fumeus]|uniref:leukocyte immunoglobulin-like receptor subfamily A member 5 n=1 Tax=Sorex fumeus TaxID=62283 RepID=UPI0024AD4168|nr:leukocyte immunoglobulin-like receptor subfamily A member 5 [Sorex fumeus]
MNPLMTLLCLGLSVGARTPMQAGSLPRPTFWAEPGSVMPLWSSVTFWCQGAPGAQKYVIKGYGHTGVSHTVLPLESGDKVKFPMNITGFSYAARYTCVSLECGCDPEILSSILGAYNKPFLSILSNPVVTSGSNVTLQCHSQKKFKGFALTQEGEPGPSQTLDSQPHPSGTFHALFSVGPLNPGHSWTFRCYGYMHYDQVWSQPSNPLQLLVSDPPESPAHHQDYTVGNVGRMLVGAVVLLLLGILLVEAHLSQGRLWGPSTKEGQEFEEAEHWGPDDHGGAQKYVLEGHGNDGVLGIELPLESGDKVKFPMNITGFSYAARYTCEQCGLSGCSEKSNPLQLIVTGAYNKPFLSILSNPVLTSGSNVTLQCHSQKKFKGFALTQEGEPGPSQTLDSQPHPNGTFHALFSVGPLSPGYSWTFRCYGYMNKDQVWSQPSNPLQLLISDPPRLPAHHQDYTVGNVGRMLVGAVVLLLLGILLVEAHLSQRRAESVKLSAGLDGKGPGAL